MTTATMGIAGATRKLKIRTTTPGHPNPLAEAAARGAELLDGALPGWHRRIVLDRLAMESCNRCVLGQVFGFYAVGWARLADALTEWAISEPLRRDVYRPVYFGFNIPLSAKDDRPRATRRQFHLLAVAWRTEVARRLGAEGGAL